MSGWLTPAGLPDQESCGGIYCLEGVAGGVVGPLRRSCWSFISLTDSSSNKMSGLQRLPNSDCYEIHQYGATLIAQAHSRLDEVFTYSPNVITEDGVGLSRRAPIYCSRYS